MAEVAAANVRGQGQTGAASALLAVDADFRRYRRFRNQAVPVVMPA